MLEAVHCTRGLQDSTFVFYESRSIGTCRKRLTGHRSINAVAESFFATLKTELIYGRTWPTRLELRAAVFEYIEVFYNRRRLHSSVAYRTPAQVESDFALASAA